MDYNDPNRRRNNSTPPQNIPLQDFSHPRPQYGGSEEDSDASSGRARAISETVRKRLSGGRQYAPLSERDPDYAPQERGARSGLNLAIPQNTLASSSSSNIHNVQSPTSPVDAAAFQSAIGGFSGLSFEPATPDPDTTKWPRNTRTPSLTSVDIGGQDSDSVDERSGYLTPVQTSNDRTPLTDPNYLAPISGASTSSTPTGSKDRTSRSRSVRFSNVTPTRSSRLGDDLAQAEAGMGSGDDMRRSSSLRRSLSPSSAAGSTLQRAGTIVRNMSTRIVNLSNEQDVVDRTIKRKSSSIRDRQGSTTSSSTGQESMPNLDGPTDLFGGRPLEKTPSSDEHEIMQRPSVARRTSTKDMNPLKGKSLGMFPPNNPIRTKLCDLLVHPITEPLLFILIVIQTVLLAVDSSIDPAIRNPRSNRLGNSWIDWIMLVLFSIYTVEIIARSIVSGFIVNPIEYSTINRQVGVRQAVVDKVNSLFGTPHTRPGHSEATQSTFGFGAQQPGILRSFTTNGTDDFVAQGGSKAQRRARLAHRAFLRHSFNRVDFIAVVSYWISFVLSLFALEDQRHMFVFRMLSALRILRLLYLTSGTTVILRSLKKAAPLLVNVAFLIGFFWLLFAIVGLQSFKSSLRRTCVWTDPDDPTNTWNNDMQFCGGWLADNGTAMPWLLPDGKTFGSGTHKGYLCPVQSKCVEGGNPYNGSISFDNIFQSLELVFVVMSSNTFSDLLYYLTQSDYLSAAIFFACGIVILLFWLVNLLIAVITSSFQVIREEGKASAFTGVHSETSSTEGEVLPKSKKSTLIRVFRRTKWFWIALIGFGLVVQCFRSASMSPTRRKFVDTVETLVTLILLLEIILRVIIDWRNFFKSKINVADLSLVVITCIIQLPPIHNSGQPYAWLTFFQVLRIYRVVLAVPITRDLILIVLGNFKGLLNLILFVFLLTFLAAILASQMFRGSLPQNDSQGNTINITFNSMWNSFLGMYQILSSENWTTIVYNVTNYDINFNTAWMGAAFFILWFVLANFIVLNMFIAVIQENFDVSEDEKRLQQVKAFLQQKEMGTSNAGQLSLSTIFKYGMISGRKKDPLAFGSATTEMLLKDAVVKDFLDQQDEPTPLNSPPGEEATPILRRAGTTPVIEPGGTLSNWWQHFVARFSNKEPNPFYSRLEFSRAYEDLDPRQMAKEVMSARERRKRAQREYLRKYPRYNVSLYLFEPRNLIRRLCQKIVGPGRGGDRIDGIAPSVPVWYAFSAFIYCAIVAMVILACVTTPLYQKEYFNTHTYSVKNWFVFTDMGFAALFTVEAGIKVVADGFFFTPNAYFRGSWGVIDAVVLITLWINVASSLYNEGQVSRAVGAFKALRALRLLNVSDSARNNFHAVIVRGGLKVLSAMFVSISLLIPFAIYGLNLFVGKMQSCNDSNAILDLHDCVGEFMASPANWNILAPRAVANPYYSFDNFGNSLFILFQIVSQEGWIDVMWQAIQITAEGKQPQPFTSYGYAVFFVVFNLLGAVFVLTLFVSVFMRNYTEQTGVAFLTAEQRSWLELRKLLRQISPSKRPLPNQKRETWKEWCYRRAVKKTGRWSRFVTGVLVLHLILLCVEFYPSKEWWDVTRDIIFLAFIFVYIANIVIRIIGLTWQRFRRSSWDSYALVSVSCAFVTSILALSRNNNWVFARLQRLSLVSIALLLIPRNNQLDQLFKTAAASLPLILNLLATWFVLFLTFAIALTQTFGLTKFGNSESVNVNFRDVPKALILLFRTSVGEGWNQIMEDFATMRPPYCIIGEKFQDGDCGSPEWARFLFIAWNILSMYIFVNLFVSLIYESFSYVYQRSNGLGVISREEIRRFKQAWAEFDPDGTGYISKGAFPRLLGELSGVFEMRIYDGDFTVARLIEDCSRPRRESVIGGENEPREIDIKKLNARLAELPVDAIRERRRRMNAFYEEVLVGSDPDRGISFTSLLMVLAHYNVIYDNKSLRLHEFLRRRARLQRVEEAVSRGIVIGFFDTVYWSRRFKAHMNTKSAARMTAIPQFTVPEIFVDDEDAHDVGPSPFDGGYTSATYSPNTRFGPPSSGASSIQSSPRTGAITPPSGGEDLIVPSNLSTLPPLRTRISASSIQISPSNSPTALRFPGHHAHVDSRSSIAEDWQLAQALSRPVSRDGEAEGSRSSGQHARNLSTTAAGGEEGSEARSRANSNVSARDVLDVLDNSAWGESIRKSFSTRRPSGNGGEDKRK